MAPPPAAESNSKPPPRVSLDEAWRALTETIAASGNMQLSIWLGQSAAQRLDGHTLVLTFSARQEQARKFVDTPENREIVQRILADVAPGVTELRTETETAAERESPHPDPKAKTESPAQASSGPVNPEDERAVKADPNVARVLEVFRGRVVDIKRPVNDLTDIPGTPDTPTE